MDNSFCCFFPFQIYMHKTSVCMHFYSSRKWAYMYCFVLIYKRKRTHLFLWVLFILSGVLSLYIHNLAIFFLAIPNLFLLLQRKWRFLQSCSAHNSLWVFCSFRGCLIYLDRLKKYKPRFGHPNQNPGNCTGDYYIHRFSDTGNLLVGCCCQY